MNRASIKTLETLCIWINQAMGTPETPWIKTAEGKMVAQIGNFHLSGAYGGICVHQMNNEGGGVTTPIWGGHIPKREAEALMRAYLRGIEARKDVN